MIEKLCYFNTVQKKVKIFLISRNFFNFFPFQEINSLRAVLDMRSAENRDLRVHNNELLSQVERLGYLESELRNSQHRLDEMTLVLQNKMDSERELLELSETLQEELVRSRSETLQYRKDLENVQCHAQYVFANFWPR